MKKGVRVLMTVVYVLLGACLGGAIGFCGAYAVDHLPNLPKGAAFGLLLLALIGMYVFFFLEMILHEAGHLAFGLLTGWKFVSFRIGSLLWKRDEDGKLRRSRYALAGTGGQCLMAPPPWREDFPCALYNLGGILVNLGTAVIGALLVWALWAHPLAALWPAEAALVGLFLALMNGVPMPGMVANDGGNQRSLSQSVDAKRALWVQMSVATAQARGERMKDMPENWFASFPEEAMDNVLVASVAVMRENRLLDAIDLPAAETAARALLAREKGVLPLYRGLLTMDGAVCELLAGRPADLTEALDAPEARQVMKSMKNQISVLRTKLVAALLRDHDVAEAERLQAAFDKAAAAYPYPQDLVAERALIALAREKSAA